MDPKELFELVGMVGLAAALILFTVFSKGREARVRKRFLRVSAKKKRRNQKTP